MDSRLAHFGDPCIYCGIPHDDVPPGPCRGDRTKKRFVTCLHCDYESAPLEPGIAKSAAEMHQALGPLHICQINPASKG
jgi:hypothetical protein